MEYNNIECKNIYPNLPTAPAEQDQLSLQNQAHVYRLQKISEIQKEIEREREKELR